MAANNNWNQNNSWNQINGNSGAQDGQKWNDQDIIGDLLLQEKQIINSYGQNIVEGSSDPLRGVFQAHLEQTAQDQFNVFQQMQQRGWYPTSPAKPEDLQTVTDTCTRHKGMLV